MVISIEWKMPIHFWRPDCKIVFTHIFDWQILWTCFWSQILWVKTIDMLFTTDFTGKYHWHVFWPELLFVNTIEATVFAHKSSGQKTCLQYWPIKSVVENMSIVFTRNICGRKHVRSISQGKIWVNTIAKSELLKFMGIFNSLEKTINIHGFFTVEKGDRFFPIDFTVLKP